MIVNVIPEVKVGGEMESFSYLVPEELEGEIRIGSVVSIPFGNRKIRGVVEGTTEHGANNTKYEIKSLISVDPNIIFTEKYIKIAKWISSYYLCSLGEAIELFLPPMMKKPRPGAQVESSKSKVKSPIELTNEQQEIFEKLKLSLNSKAKKHALIRGITGSGKTEIYIKLAEETLQLGKQVIVLVPEIILTPQTVERFQKTFGDQITLMHHNLSKSEKFNCYFDFYTGKKPIIVGPRSALLIPCPNIGLIIIDEEQEDSFKQDQNPRYHAVTLAEKIAEATGAQLLLGSATPKIETFHKAKTGQFDLFELTERYNSAKLPPAEIVDLRNELRTGNNSPISEKLRQSIEDILEKKKQILLFLNRRGTSTFVSCRDCGHVIICKNCSIPLIYHLYGQKSELNCHHCDFRQDVPITCPKCHSPKIKFFGSGIEKIETEIRKLFPLARVARVDASTIKSKTDYEKFYLSFKNHEIDIAIGTQMIAKGLDIPGVDLVGIVSADTGLHLPYYRASEKSFQILTQVSGRSGRRGVAGKTILQTYWPEAKPIIDASLHDYQTFYKDEIAEREKHNYPPFQHLIRIISEDESSGKAIEKIRKVAAELAKNKLSFIGPGACFYERLHNKFRFHIIVKVDKLPDQRLHEVAKLFPHLVWDVDAVNLL
ncbi:MAG: primosomal protein N' [Patescibacteria group bacterium]|jgi:primosomal protein N' (replication factor Y)